MNLCASTAAARQLDGRLGNWASKEPRHLHSRININLHFVKWFSSILSAINDDFSLIEINADKPDRASGRRQQLATVSAESGKRTFELIS